MTIKTESANCANCGQPFVRRAGRSNPRRYCVAVRCQKVKNIKNSVARLDTLPKPTMSTYLADIQYHGAPNL